MDRDVGWRAMRSRLCSTLATEGDGSGDENRLARGGPTTSQDDGAEKLRLAFLCSKDYRSPVVQTGLHSSR